MTKKISLSILFMLTLVSLISAAPSFSAVNTSETVSSAIASSTYQSKSLPADFVITAIDLSKAGFTGIEEIKPEQGRFELPVQYFKVEEKTASSAQDCEDCLNLISIYITPAFTSSSPNWILDKNPVITKIGSRTQYKWFVGFRILYITGPREELVINLAKELRERIVLNKISPR